MEPTGHATLNAFLNALAAGLLYAGWVRIKRAGDMAGHKRIMIMALTASALFLVSYLLYHARVGSVPYPYHDWTRTLYFVILIPHVILAAVQLPFIVIAVWFALHGQYDKHRKVVRLLWPVWMFVSVTGVVVYLMLYRI